MRRRHSLFLAAGAALLMCVTGCSGGDGQAAKSTAKPLDSTANDMNAHARAALKEGGTLQWAMGEAIPNFNFYEIDGTLTDTFNVSTALLPRPFHYSAAAVPSVNNDYFTDISASTSTGDAPLTVTYTINPKASWSDGKAITWQDFKSLWQASNGKNTAYKVSQSTGYDRISGVAQGKDERQAVVTFAKPFADWKGLFDPLVPSSLTATPTAFNSGWADHPTVTAGPFVWGGADKTAQTFTLARNPKWWGDPAKLDKIVFRVYDDYSAAVQAFRTGQVDYAELPPDTQIYQAAKKTSGVTVRTAGSAVYRQFTLNKRDPLLSDRRVRQAVVLGIDRVRMATLLVGKIGGQSVALQNHIFMPNQSAYEKTCGTLCSYAPAKAQKLLQEAGWTKGSDGYFAKNGKRLELTITIQSGRVISQNEAEIAQATLKEAGIKLDIKTVPVDDFFGKYITVGNFQLTTFTWNGVALPVGGSLSIYTLDPKNVQQNYGAGGSTEINALLGKAVTADDTATENKLANEADRQIWADASWLPLYQLPQDNAVRSTIANLGAYGFADIRFQDIGYVK